MCVYDTITYLVSYLFPYDLSYMFAGAVVSCKRTLEPGRCTEHDTQLFCHQCHHKRFGPHALKTASSTAAAAAMFVTDVIYYSLTS